MEFGTIISLFFPIISDFLDYLEILSLLLMIMTLKVKTTLHDFRIGHD
jgi:hypothetical protein